MPRDTFTDGVAGLSNALERSAKRMRGTFRSAPGDVPVNRLILEEIEAGLVGLLSEVRFYQQHFDRGEEK